MSYSRKETPETKQMKRDAGVAFLTGAVGALVSSALVMYELLVKVPVEKMPLALAPGLLGFVYILYAKNKLRRAIDQETTQIDL